MLRRLIKIVGLAVSVLGVLLLAVYAIQSFDGYTSQNPVETSGGVDPTTIETGDGSSASLEGPEDKTLRLTVPEADIENATIPTAAPTEAALRDNVAVRLPETGLPWQEETNVYIAGHELGYPFTDSFRAFYDVKDVEEGDEVYLTDATGTRYAYEVFDILIVQPDDLWVVDTLQGRNIVSLQASETQQKQGDVTPKRVVRAELIEKS